MKTSAAASHFPPNRRPLRSEIEAYNATIKTIPRRTGPEKRVYFAFTVLWTLIFVACLVRRSSPVVATFFEPPSYDFIGLVVVLPDFIPVPTEEANVDPWNPLCYSFLPQELKNLFGNMGETWGQTGRTPIISSRSGNHKGKPKPSLCGDWVHPCWFLSTARLRLISVALAFGKNW